jgi:choline dehydrogenase-like flavoprotein
MEHPHIRSGVIHFRDPDAIAGLGLYQPQPTGEGDIRVHGLLALDEQVIRDRGLLNHVYYLDPMSQARASAAVRSAAALRNAVTMRHIPDNLGAHVKEVVRRPVAVATSLREMRHRGSRPSDVLGLLSMAEQPPTPDSRITLGSRVDSIGLPVARVDWRPTDSVRTTMRAAQDLLDEGLRDQRLGWVDDKLGDEWPPRHMIGGWHQMGTTRMDPDPRRGVVDEYGTVHGFENLHVAGASLFPTGGYANPTLTIVALALRQAEHLAAVLH